MNRKVSTNHYCARCRMTTVHDETDSESRCRRCGAVKSNARRTGDEPRASMPHANTKIENTSSAAEVRWN